MEVEFREFDTNCQMIVLGLILNQDRSINEIEDLVFDFVDLRYIPDIYFGRAISDLVKAERISTYNGDENGVFQVFCHIKPRGVAYYKFLFGRHVKYNELIQTALFSSLPPPLT